MRAGGNVAAMHTTDADLARRYDRPVPRYTSYPTAAQFSAAVQPADLARWLMQQRDRRLATYVHIPFCRSLCWYCACHTAVVNRPEVLADYADGVAREAALLRRFLPDDTRIAARQWGGGTPTHLGPKAFAHLARWLQSILPLTRGGEHAVEIDPRSFDAEMADVLAEAGVNRASFGVQDFSLPVQQAINRLQSFEQTAKAVELLRDRGIGGINLDLVYGLPKQSLRSLESTLNQALELSPDRIAVFGYAHVPWMKPHQRLIVEADLAGASERHAMTELVARHLIAAGYRRIGLDHYARPEDALSRAAEARRLRRSFQGYEAERLDGTLGLGASAITGLDEGYAQNLVETRAWASAIRSGALATARGVRLSDEDRLRARVIARLLCDFQVDLRQEAQDEGDLAMLRADLPGLTPFLDDGLAEIEGHRIAVTERGRPWVRSLASIFDRHHRPDSGRHARAV